nr:cytochrome P450 2J2-like [Parasteatoda tepidariorum]
MPHSVVIKDMQGGFVSSNGAEWIEERRYVMRVIKDIGMGKTRWEDDLDAEIESFLKSVSEFDGKPVDLHDYLSHSVSNNMTSMVLGRRIPTGDSRNKMINEAVDGLSVFGQAGAVTYFPDLMKFLAKTGFSKLRVQYNNMKKLYDFMRNEVELRKSSFENSEELVFIDGYLKLMKSSEEKNIESNFSVNSLIANSQAMILAGSETIRTSLLWLFLDLASFPDIQKNCRDEIQGGLGKDGKFRWSDAKKPPYTYATTMEGQRWKTVAPLGLSPLGLFRAREDTKIGGYHIPKGAIVISNAWALHNDPEYWPEPEKFEPERFLLEDGTLNKKSESYIPFSLGRRNCPGESIAMMEIFRYLVSILQKYEILPLEDHLPALEGEVGLTFYHYRQEIRFIPRD